MMMFVSRMLSSGLVSVGCCVDVFFECVVCVEVALLDFF